MFGLSFGEIAIIAVLALLLLGPERLPEAAKTIGKGLRDFRRATEDLKGQIETEIYADEQKTPKPSLVPPVPAKPSEPAGPPPAASAENVPGLDIALLEPLSEPPPEPASPPASEPAPAAVAAAPTAPETKPT